MVNMAKDSFIVRRTPSQVKTAHGHLVCKWCGSCAYKEMKDKRMCSKLGIEVAIDNICPEWMLEEKIARL